MFEGYPNVFNEKAGEAYVQKAVADKYDHIKLMHEAGGAIGVATEEIIQPAEAVQAAVVRAAHRFPAAVAHQLPSWVFAMAILEINIRPIALMR